MTKCMHRGNRSALYLIMREEFAWMSRCRMLLTSPVFSKDLKCLYAPAFLYTFYNFELPIIYFACPLPLQKKCYISIFSISLRICNRHTAYTKPFWGEGGRGANNVSYAQFENSAFAVIVNNIVLTLTSLYFLFDLKVTIIIEAMSKSLYFPLAGLPKNMI